MFKCAYLCSRLIFIVIFIMIYLISLCGNHAQSSMVGFTRHSVISCIVMIIVSDNSSMVKIIILYSYYCYYITRILYISCQLYGLHIHFYIVTFQYFLYYSFIITVLSNSILLSTVPPFQFSPSISPLPSISSHSY